MMTRDIMEDLNEIILMHSGKILGLLLGFIFALVALSFGFTVVLLLMICIGGGYFWGWRVDEKKSVRQLMRRLISHFR